jgi:calcium permeable stress-gated cation channel
MTFFASLSSVEQLKKDFDWIADAIEAFPILQPLLQQLAPFLVVAFNALLPMILEFLSMMEGPISGAAVEALMFTKLSAFAIIQTFFVSAISSGLIESLPKFAGDPMKLVNLLAKSLPTQSTYFIQITFVRTTILIVTEMLRTTPLITAFIRKFIGPRLTEKERRKTVFGLRPLADPSEFAQADMFSKFSRLHVIDPMDCCALIMLSFVGNHVLYFTIIFVYSTVAPIVNFVLGFLLLLLASLFRHQFIFIYPATPDSGGRLWINFMRLLASCMVSCSKGCRRYHPELDPNYLHLCVL